MVNHKFRTNAPDVPSRMLSTNDANALYATHTDRCGRWQGEIEPYDREVANILALNRK